MIQVGHQHYMQYEVKAILGYVISDLHVIMWNQVVSLIYTCV